MFNKVTVTEKNRGLLFRNGRLEKILGPGRHFAGGSRTVELHDVKKEILSSFATPEALAAAFPGELVEVRVADGHLALHSLNGVFAGVLEPGLHVFFREGGEHAFQDVDTADCEVSDDVDRNVFLTMDRTFFTRILVNEYQRARLYVDGKFERLLEPGTYYFWNNGRDVDWEPEDIRLQQMEVNGQEMLTADKVTLRVNFVFSYRVTDFVQVASGADDYREQLRTAAQLALRAYVGRWKLDEILDNKDKLSECVRQTLAEKAPSLFVEITDAGVQDVILPGEIRDIMNTVLIAEKQAQANVITRREEVASTRSLLNTAKLMDENQTLYRLKEMEFMERICDNVGSITLNGSGDILEQLSKLMNRK